MKVLVSAASKHGSTAEIAAAIGTALSSTGIDVDVRSPDDVATVAPYDGVVLGSGVYAGRWLEPMKKLIAREAAELAFKPVWFFSSGPLGDPPKPEEEPADVAALRETVHPIGSAVFAGRLDRHDLGFAERAIVSVVHAPDGDFRSWPTVSAWASGIARTLETSLAEEAIR
jgi:menaquinone-dependent protoporphyrinogen oxidase